MSDNDEFCPIYHPKDENYPLKFLREASPGADAAMLKRMMYDLECQARQAISEWSRLRGGKANHELAQERAQQRATLKEINELDKYLKAVREQLIRRFGRHLFKYHMALDQQLIETLDRLEAAAATARQQHTVPPRKNKSDAKVAKDLLDEFLVVVTVIWCQSTAEPPTRGITPDEREPSGLCSAFLNSAAQPLINQINASQKRPVLPTGWPALFKRVSKLFKPISKLKPKLEDSLRETILGIDIQTANARKRKRRQSSKSM